MALPDTSIGPAHASQPGTPTAAPSAPGRPALKRMDPAALQAVVAAAAKKLLVPGAVVLLRTPQGSFVATAGTTKLGARTPPDADTYVRIASNTKTMTAALIVLLAQDGKLRLDDPVSAYVPDAPNGRNITIAELLKMRSGLDTYTDAPELAAALDADPTRVWTPRDPPTGWSTSRTPPACGPPHGKERSGPSTTPTRTPRHAPPGPMTCACAGCPPDGGQHPPRRGRIIRPPPPMMMHSAAERL
ncbi:serine hydrolase domain-containing protein [Nonomuraea sp. NPDC050383]|uniref:serine hydrolase domain-containing protein n=1 Tax=Nonomuraea sp. NPDC050383 TaxID=3364362 RepID=UPI0037BBB6A2